MNYLFTPEQTAQWDELVEKLKKLVQKNKISLEGILLLIGMREMGMAPEKFSKDIKQDLIHVGMCTILEPGGYYKALPKDPDGWPHWELTKPLPFLDPLEQVNFIRLHVLGYFEGVFEE